MRTAYIILFLLGFTFACEKEQASISGGYELEIGHTVSFEQGVLEIQFDQVIADSRCPIGSNCENPGQAIIELIITNGGGVESYQFTSLDPASKSHEIDTPFGKYEIEFIDLYPYPVLNEPLEAFQTIVLELKN